MSKIRHQVSRKAAKNLFKQDLRDLRQDASMVSLCKTIQARLISKTMVNGSLISSRLWPEKYSLKSHSSNSHRGDLTCGIRCRARMTMKMRRHRGAMSISVLTCTTCSK